MIWRRNNHDDKPRPDEAREALERVKAQRPDVERLVDALNHERVENHFALNIERVFMGRKRA